MAEFSKIIPTDNGRAMIADVMAGSTMVFTKMVLSDTEYTVDELYTLTDIADIKQESEITSVFATSSAAVRVSAAFINEGLTEGYTIRSIGLYAKEEDGDEILYAAAIETTGTYEMPAQTGTTISSAYMQWIVTVGNAENVTVEISSNAYALAIDVNQRFDAIELEMEDFLKTEDIVDNCTTTDAKRPLSANQGKVLYDLYQNIDQSLSGSFAPIKHASSETTYGLGTSSLYGHLKVSDNYTSSAGAASAGVAASSQAVYNTYNTLLSKFTDGSVSKIGTSTVGSATKPIYLNSGTPTASSSTVGSGTKPIYLSSGTLTASSSTVGSTTQPVYMSSGTLTAMSGALATTYGGTGNTSGRATYVNVTTTNPTSGTTYYIPWTTGISSGSNYSLNGNNGLRYNCLEGTTSDVGYGVLYLGNSTASGTAGNKNGRIRIYGSGENYWTLSGNKANTSNYTLYLPLSGGCLVAATNGSAVGSGTNPVYINSSGVATASSSTVGSGTKPMYLSSGTLTASSSTVGSSTNPVYLNSGTLTACTGSWTRATLTWNSNVVYNGGHVYYNAFTKMGIAYVDCYFSGGLPSSNHDWCTIFTFTGCTVSNYWGAHTDICTRSSRTSTGYPRAVGVWNNEDGENEVRIDLWSGDADYNMLFAIPFAIT